MKMIGKYLLFLVAFSASFYAALIVLYVALGVLKGVVEILAYCLKAAA